MGSPSFFKWVPAAQAASTADLAATFTNNGGAGDTLSKAGLLTTDAYTAVVGDRILVKNQTAMSQNGVYKVTYTGGAIAASSFTQPSGGTVTNGTYSNVALTGGTGFGAQATIVVAGGVVTSVVISAAGSDYSAADTLGYTGVGLGTGGTVVVTNVTGVIATTSGLTQPTVGTLVNAVYTGVNLTGGSGTGAQATVTVAGGVVTTVVVTAGGLGYSVGNVLGYTGIGFGAGGTVTVATTSALWIAARADDAVTSEQLSGLTSFIGNGTAGAGHAYVQVVDPVVVNTTNLVFSLIV